MKELEKAIDQLKKENDRIEKAQNRAKLLNQKINKLKRNAETCLLYTSIYQCKESKIGIFNCSSLHVRKLASNFYIKK